MKVSIIVHSQTGNTFTIAQKLQETFLQKGHTVNLERLVAHDETCLAGHARSKKKIQLKTIPNLSSYDVVIFGAPTQAFSLSKVMRAYLAQPHSLQGKKVGCLITHGLSRSWMGAKRATSQLRKACKDRGGSVFGEAMVHCSQKQEWDVSEVITNLSNW